LDKRGLINTLTKIANELDNMGMLDVANKIDQLVKRAALTDTEISAIAIRIFYKLKDVSKDLEAIGMFNGDVEKHFRKLVEAITVRDKNRDYEKSHADATISDEPDNTAD